MPTSEVSHWRYRGGQIWSLPVRSEQCGSKRVYCILFHIPSSVLETGTLVWLSNRLLHLGKACVKVHSLSQDHFLVENILNFKITVSKYATSSACLHVASATVVFLFLYPLTSYIRPHFLIKKKKYVAVFLCCGTVAPISICHVA